MSALVLFLILVCNIPAVKADPFIEHSSPHYSHEDAQSASDPESTARTSITLPLDVVNHIIEHLAQPLSDYRNTRYFPDIWQGEYIRNSARDTLLAVSACSRALRAIAMPVLVRNLPFLDRQGVAGTVEIWRNVSFAIYTAPKWGQYVEGHTYVSDADEHPSEFSETFFKITAILPPPKSILLQLGNKLDHYVLRWSSIDSWVDSFRESGANATALEVSFPQIGYGDEKREEVGLTLISPLVLSWASNLKDLSLYAVALPNAACNAILAAPNLRVLSIIYCTFTDFNPLSAPSDTTAKLTSLTVDNGRDTIKFIEYLFLYAQVEHLGLHNNSKTAAVPLTENSEWFPKHKPTRLSLLRWTSLSDVEACFGGSIIILRLYERHYKPEELVEILTSGRFPCLEHLELWRPWKRDTDTGWGVPTRENLQGVCKGRGVEMSSYPMKDSCFL